MFTEKYDYIILLLSKLPMSLELETIHKDSKQKLLPPWASPLTEHF
jgi:hypothetical protein